MFVKEPWSGGDCSEVGGVCPDIASADAPVTVTVQFQRAQMLEHLEC